MGKLSKLLNRHAISFKVESNLVGNFIKSTTSATHYNVADEIVNELNAIKRGKESSNDVTAELPLHGVMPMLLKIAETIDNAVENTDPDDIAFGKISDAVELLGKIHEDNRMLERN